MLSLITLVWLILSNFQNYSQNPEEILKKMIELYSSLGSYHDEGKVTAFRENGTIETRNFKIYYSRPNFFKFDLTYMLYPGGQKNVALFSDGGKVYLSEDGKTHELMNLEEGINSLSGLSLGASYFVPLLILKLKIPFLLLNLKDLHFEEIKGEDQTFYYVLRGKHPKKEATYSIWIRKRDYALCKIKWNMGNTIIEEEHFNIHINDLITKEYFERIPY